MELTIERLSDTGEGIAHTADGKICLVPGTFPGDVVEANVQEDHKRFLKATVARYITRSQNRVQFPCAYVESCGGCVWGELAHDAQQEAKASQVVAAFLHGAGLHVDPLPLVPSKHTLLYRNKIELACEQSSRGLRLGYKKEGTHELVPVSTCKVFCGAQNKLDALAGALSYLSKSGGAQVLRVGLRNSKRTGEFELALWTEPGSFPRGMYAKVFKDAPLPITSLVRVQARLPLDARNVVNVEHLAGKGSWHEKLGQCRYKVSAPSFFQVNTPVAEKMVAHVEHLAASLGTNLSICDLFCGVGTFTLPLAKYGHVLAVEAQKSSVRDLQANIEANHIQNIEVEGRDVAKLAMPKDLDLVLVDPPRSGLHKRTTAWLAEKGPKNLIYVSCNPQTLARDARQLVDGGYSIDTVAPFDLFPNTPHVETIVHFTR